MGFHQLSCDIKPETDALGMGFSFGTIEAVENVWDVLRSDAAPLVGHG